MSQIKAMRAIAKHPILKPYISPKRLQRVAKCCEHYQNLGYSEINQTANILKRLFHTEAAFSDKLIAQYPEQFERFVPNYPEIHRKMEHENTDKEPLKAISAFNAYIRKAKKIVGDSILANGDIL